MRSRSTRVRFGVAVGVAALAGARGGSRWLRGVRASTSASIGGPATSSASRLARCTHTRAVSIDAAPHDVWQWLMQIGEDRRGFFSYAGKAYNVVAEVHPVSS